MIGLKHSMLALVLLIIDSAVQATPPLLRCADLVIEADRASKKLTENHHPRIQQVDGNKISNPAELISKVRSPGFEASIVSGGDFEGWDFSEQKLGLTCFVDTNLSKSNWNGASLNAPAFIKTNLENADFQNSIVRHIFFRNSNLKNLDARNADLSWGHFQGGWFQGSVSGWNIDGANMSGFTFDCGITLDDGCPVYQGGDPISAKGTNFTRATLHSFGLYSVELEGAILDKTIIGPGQIPELHNAKIAGGVVLRGGKQDVALSSEEFSQLVDSSKVASKIGAQPAFDCGKTSNEAEHYICGEYGQALRQADREMKVLYDRVKRKNPSVRSSQLAWLKTRNECGLQEHPYGCITDRYSLRKGELLAILGAQEWLKPGKEALFIDEVLPVSQDLRQSALYKRIMPTLIGASMTEILVKREKDGLFSIRGSSVGANAHLCSLGASHLYFDKKTGWYVPVSEGKAQPVFRIFNGRLEIFANGRPDYEKYPDAGNYMSCGMRASFGEVIQIDADQASISRIRKSLEETM